MINNLRMKLFKWSAIQPVYVFTLVVGTPFAFLPFFVLPIRDKFFSRKSQPSAEFAFEGKKY